MLDLSPARIAFAITDLDVGGAERCLVQLATGLDRARWEPAVFCLGPEGALAPVLRVAGVPTTCFGASRPGDVRSFLRFVRALRRFRPQLLQTFLFHANFAGRLAGRLAAVPHVVSGIRVADRRTLPGGSRRLRQRLDCLTARLADAHVCVSRGVARFARASGCMPSGRLLVIPNAIDPQPFDEAAPADLGELGIPPRAAIVLYVGRLDPQKGLGILLEAMTAVARDQPAVHLVLVGDGPERGPLELLRSELRLVGKVHFAGWRPDVPRWMRAARLLVLPSLWEGMANVILEAMAAGLPVLATDVEGSNELIVHGKTGWLVAPRCADAIAEGLLRLLGDAALRSRIAAAARARVGTFSAPAMVARYDGLYTRLLRGRHGRNCGLFHRTGSHAAP